MQPASFVALLLAAIGPLLVLARLARLPPTLVLAGAGAAVAALPGAPPLRLDPDLAIALFLPPVIYAGSVSITPHLLRAALLPGLLVGLVVGVAIVGGTAALVLLLLPGLGGAQAALLGVVAALFDTRLFHEAEGRPRVPRALADALKAREMAARIVALTAFALALEALAEHHPPGPAEAAFDIAWSLAGGAALGWAIGRAVTWLRGHARPAPVETAMSLASPYLAGLAAAALSLSLAVTVIAAALAVSAARVDPESGEARSSAEARITATAFWEEASLLASSVLFFFAGLALPEALADLGAWPVWQVGGAAAAILGLVLLVQWLGSLLAARLPPLSEALAREEGATPARAAGVMAWASTASVIGLIAALAIPTQQPDGTPTPDRDVVLVVAALFILGSVLLQGLTLRLAVRRAGLARPEQADAEEDKARQVAAEAREDAPHDAHPEALAAERRVLMRLRAEDVIGDEALRKLLREGDLRARAAEASAGSTGGGPPQP